MTNLRRYLADEPTSAPTFAPSIISGDDASQKNVSIFIVAGVGLVLVCIGICIFKCCCQQQENKRKIVQCLAQE
jgi:hypothetical protein